VDATSTMPELVHCCLLAKRNIAWEHWLQWQHFLQWLNTIWNDWSLMVTREKPHEYLGMTLDYSTPGQVSIGICLHTFTT
jgi:hypothetical protein